jgi:1,4-dihydroxy-2-naphthoate octaprenyltransferase
LLLALAGLPLLPGLFSVFGSPKPGHAPRDYPPEIWPLWFSAHAFRHTRHFTTLFLAGLLLDTLLS